MRTRREEELEESGEFGTTDYAMTFKADGKVISPWHDIPLEAGEGSPEAPRPPAAANSGGGGAAAPRALGGALGMSAENLNNKI